MPIFLATEDMMEVIKYMSPFGLVAFVVIWWTMKVAPNLEKSSKEMRSDFLNAQETGRQQFLTALETQRKDFIDERAHDRAMKERLAEGFEHLAKVTSAHVLEARAVWQSRGELPYKETET